MLPTIEYCCSIWDPYHQNVIDKLEMIQHRAARFVLNRPWNRHQRDSITDMLKELNWPSLQDRRRHARLILMYKITNHLQYIYCLSQTNVFPPHLILPVLELTILKSFPIHNQQLTFTATHFHQELSPNGTICLFLIYQT